MGELASQKTRECLLCLRIPLEMIRSSVEAILLPGDDIVIDRIANRAAKLIAIAYKKDRFALCGKKPTGIMAAAIYLSGRMENGVKLSQRVIAYELKIAKASIVKRTRQINDLLDLGIVGPREQRKLYVCPFCEKTFPHIFRLMWHLSDGGFPYTFLLRIRMFNDDGILVDKEMLEKMRRDSGTCERPPTVRLMMQRRASYYDSWGPS